MNVEQLVWWWDQGWRSWARQHGVDPDEKAKSKITTPDKEAMYRLHPELKTTGIARG